ncbi:transcriptional elongation regulator Elc1/Elongin C [Penicillium verhagenii]|nr:transcriptional elongation regulator Elc1/Elongin C [Penicillium verhagenii]
MASSEAPRFEYVTLVSFDGYEYVIPYDAVLCSGTLRRMLDPKNSFQEAITGRCVLETISGFVLKEVCFYFLYNHAHKNEPDVPDMEIPTELCLELLMAADYLDV